jgi:hypothetical protein
MSYNDAVIGGSLLFILLAVMCWAIGKLEFEVIRLKNELRGISRRLPPTPPEPNADDSHNDISSGKKADA